MNKTAYSIPLPPDIQQLLDKCEATDAKARQVVALANSMSWRVHSLCQESDLICMRAAFIRERLPRADEGAKAKIASLMK